jgi:hypothetical protein
MAPPPAKKKKLSLRKKNGTLASRAATSTTKSGVQRRKKRHLDPTVACTNTEGAPSSPTLSGRRVRYRSSKSSQGGRTNSDGGGGGGGGNPVSPTTSAAVRAGSAKRSTPTGRTKRLPSPKPCSPPMAVSQLGRQVSGACEPVETAPTRSAGTGHRMWDTDGDVTPGTGDCTGKVSHRHTTTAAATSNHRNDRQPAAASFSRNSRGDHVTSAGGGAPLTSGVFSGSSKCDGTRGGFAISNDFDDQPQLMAMALTRTAAGVVCALRDVASDCSGSNCDGFSNGSVMFRRVVGLFPEVTMPQRSPTATVVTAAGGGSSYSGSTSFPAVC